MLPCCKLLCCSHCSPGNRLGLDKTTLCVNPLTDLPLLNPARDLSILCLPSSTVCSVVIDPACLTTLLVFPSSSYQLYAIEVVIAAGVTRGP
ncbi:unnamed protein product [Staurois parvus]|uniref:Secreted protein n=1 Tax=Staurois parvus TaxID=386267 RepID=A0ABN9EM36_9NEOB|nr:unnamed protein product [Staurois parvus]